MKTVIEMAHEAGGTGGGHLVFTLNELERFAELVRADERARMAEQPAQRKPLTDEQITQVANETYGPTSEWEVEQIRLDFARSIEAAHGIKENT